VGKDVAFRVPLRRLFAALELEDFGDDLCHEPAFD
jgi:hypothetical protein